jgi:hypothetical protein
MKLPKNDRSAYKLFFEEKRLEIFQYRAKIYDESLSGKPGSEPVESIISLSNLNDEVKEMWEELSTQVRDNFKVRAMMMDVKRPRVPEKEEQGLLDLSPSASFVEFPSVNISRPSEREDMCDNLIARSVDSNSSNYGVAPEQMSARKKHSVALLKQQSCDEPSVEHSTGKRFQGHTNVNEILSLTRAYEETQSFSQHPSTNLSSTYFRQSSAPMALTPASCEYYHPTPHMYTSSMGSTSLGYYAPALMYTSPMGYFAPPGYYCTPQSTYCSMSNLAYTQSPYYLFSGDNSEVNDTYPYYRSTQGKYTEDGQKTDALSNSRDGRSRNR